MSNPYEHLEDYQFWARSVTAPAPGRIDPVIATPVIEPHHKVATMGSCFSQRLSRHIQACGLHYLVVETPPPGLDAAAARARQYGIFSARYGNIYTVKQALQLFQRAFGTFVPAEDVWPRGDRFVDPFRPRIEPEGYANPEQVREAAAEHLGHVRKVFTDSDWLILTLGLTEAWRSVQDGAVYPLPPGVTGGNYDPEQYEFVNFSAQEISDDLTRFVTEVAGVNPSLRIILTVSPVPIVATYEKRHVLVSSTCSKAALRVAADVVERRFPNVIYFPSYEIVTSPAAGGRYYEDNLRAVTDIGIKHVMRVFGDHFFPTAAPPADDNAIAHMAWVVEQEASVICDEEEIETALLESGSA